MNRVKYGPVIEFFLDNRLFLVEIRSKVQIPNPPFIGISERLAPRFRYQ